MTPRDQAEQWPQTPGPHQAWVWSAAPNTTLSFLNLSLAYSFLAALLILINFRGKKEKYPKISWKEGRRVQVVQEQKVKMKVAQSCPWLFATLWTRQSMGFSRQEYWSADTKSHTHMANKTCWERLFFPLSPSNVSSYNGKI